MPAPAESSGSAASHTSGHTARTTRLVASVVLLAAGLAGLAATADRAPLPDPADRTPAPVPTTLINVNTATAAQLELLPRIGPALSARIVEDRAANGPFRTLDDLDRVRGIGPRTIQTIRGHATAE